MKKQFSLYAPFSKIDHEKHMVYGYATTNAVDSDEEVVTLEATKVAMEDYSKWRNIREMHQLKAVGIAPELTLDTKGLFVGAKIVDEDAWNKVTEGVYKGYSIGGDNVVMEPRFNETAKKTLRHVTSYRLKEISLVDRPANPEAAFSMIKVDGGNPMVEETKEAPPEEKLEKAAETEADESIKNSEAAAPIETPEIKAEPIEVKPPEPPVEVPAAIPADMVQIKISEYEELKKIKHEHEEMQKREKLDETIISRLKELAPFIKGEISVEKSERERISAKNIGELAIESGFFSNR